ncbi:MAG: hypothetical protein ACFFEF_14350, partial [Candidatus Thorarchaeota archaeon]
MTEEESRFQKRRHARLCTINSLTSETPNPVRILCIVVDAQPGAALVQDIIDAPDKQGSIRVVVDQELSVAEKYVLLGDVKMMSSQEGKELRLIVFSAINVNSLDVKLYKQSLELEQRL